MKSEDDAPIFWDRWEAWNLLSNSPTPSPHSAIPDMLFINLEAL